MMLKQNKSFSQRVQFFVKRKSNWGTLQKFTWAVIRLNLLIGLTFVIIFPFLDKFASMFMSYVDFHDTTVNFFPKNPTLDNIKYVFDSGFTKALLNSFLIALLAATCVLIMSSLVAYGLAAFKFKGKILVFITLILSVLIPPQILAIPMYSFFRYFDVFGIISLFTGDTIMLTDSVWPIVFLNSTGFGLKNGIFILMMYQNYIRIPQELPEAAYVDGAGVFKTFFSIILAQTRAIQITIFAIAFCWQWTDVFYTGHFFSQFKVLPNFIKELSSRSLAFYGLKYVPAVLLNTSTLMAIIPLMIVYVFLQKRIVQGIEHSGLVG